MKTSGGQLQDVLSRACIDPSGLCSTAGTFVYHTFQLFRLHRPASTTISHGNYDALDTVMWSLAYTSRRGIYTVALVPLSIQVRAQDLWHPGISHTAAASTDRTSMVNLNLWMGNYLLLVNLKTSVGGLSHEAALCGHRGTGLPFCSAACPAFYTLTGQRSRYVVKSFKLV